VESLPSKRRILEKRKRKRKKELVLKSERGETSYEKLHVSKGKNRMKFTSCWERFYQEKERKVITFSYSAKSNV
jgi:hypothetical protein